MTPRLDLADLQGLVLRSYGRESFPRGRALLLHVTAAAPARRLLDRLRRRVTTAEPWAGRGEDGSGGEAGAAGSAAVPRPQVTLNLAFTYRGLEALEVPQRTLRAMPEPFQQGMLSRSAILQDDPSLWDPIWRAEQRDPDEAVHILVLLHGAGGASRRPDSWDPGPLEAATDELLAWCGEGRHGLRLLSGHCGANPHYQEFGALEEPDPAGGRRYSRKEHFGFDDGIADPVFAGQHSEALMAERVRGQGSRGADGRWVPLATGEFLLGYPDESQELPGAAPPQDFSRGGTFLVYRKLHQNVPAFEEVIAAQARSYGRLHGLAEGPARQTLRAKMVGRWPDGVPLVLAPTHAAWQEFQRRWQHCRDLGDPQALQEFERQFVDFTYAAADPDGARCPFGAHIRRSNPRDMLDPALPESTQPQSSGPIAADRARASTVLNDRRRLLRRGAPYGQAISADPAGLDGDGGDADAERGMLFMALCASIFRQFEFVQQQWIQYGLDFDAGNDTCPIAGNHGEGARFVIPADPQSGQPPFICSGLRTFVETRGGAYFFVPSLTALRLIAQGLIDPT
ncbi:MAG: hypothetical protein WAM11_15055 [Cyanobium sp.]